MPTVAEAARGRDEGMALAAANTPEAWMEEAYRLVVLYARWHEFMHVDEWWTWAQERGLSTPVQPKALGPVMQRAARARVLVRTTSAAPSVRSHLSLKPVWYCSAFTGRRTGLFRGQPVAVRVSAS